MTHYRDLVMMMKELGDIPKISSPKIVLRINALMTNDKIISFDKGKSYVMNEFTLIKFFLHCGSTYSDIFEKYSVSDLALRACGSYAMDIVSRSIERSDMERIRRQTGIMFYDAKEKNIYDGSDTSSFVIDENGQSYVGGIDPFSESPSEKSEMIWMPKKWSDMHKNFYLNNYVTLMCEGNIN